MIESPSNGRATVLKNGFNIEVAVPTKKNWFLIIFLSFWICGWFFGETTAIGTMFRNDTPIIADGFLLIWLCAWTIGGCFTITILLWSVAGEEIVNVENGVIEIGKQIFSFKRSKKYHISEVKHLSINPISDTDMWGRAYQRNLFGLKGGVLKFDYGLKTLKFASGIDEAEGRLLIGIFKANPNFKEENFG